MNLLSDLNTAATAIIEYADDRAARAVLSKKFVNDVQITIDSTSVTPVYKTNIDEIINYTTAAVEFSVEIRSDSTPALTGSSITFPTLPAHMSSATVGDKTTLTGFRNAQDWASVKNFTWTLPGGYASIENFYLRLEIQWYDAATSSTVNEHWNLYDVRYFGQIFAVESTVVAQPIANRFVDETLNVVSTLEGDPYVRLSTPAVLPVVASISADIESFSQIDPINSSFAITANVNGVFESPAALPTLFTVTPNTQRQYTHVDSLSGYSSGTIWTSNYTRLTTQIKLADDASQIVFGTAAYSGGAISSYAGYNVSFNGTSFGTPSTNDVGKFINAMSTDGTYVLAVDAYNSLNIKMHKLSGGSYSSVGSFGKPALPVGETGFTRWHGIALSALADKAAVVWEGNTSNWLTIYDYNTSTDSLTEDTTVDLGTDVNGPYVSTGKQYYYDHASLEIGYSVDTGNYHVAYVTALTDTNRSVKVRNSSDSYATAQNIENLSANTSIAIVGPQAVHMSKDASQLIVISGNQRAEIWSRSGVTDTWTLQETTDGFDYFYGLDSEYAHHPWSIQIVDDGKTIFTSSVTDRALTYTYSDDGTYMDFLDHIPSGFVRVQFSGDQSNYTVIDEIEHPGTPATNDFAFGHVVKASPNGKWLIIASDDSIHIYRDVNTG